MTLIIIYFIKRLNNNLIMTLIMIYFIKRLNNNFMSSYRCTEQFLVKCKLSRHTSIK